MSETDSGVLLSVKDVQKRFGGVDVLKGVSIDVRKGEFFSLLGLSTAELRARLEWFDDLGDATEAVDTVWTEIRAGETTAP